MLTNQIQWQAYGDTPSQVDARQVSPRPVNLVQAVSNKHS